MTDNIGGANDIGQTKSSEIEEWKRGGVSQEGIWFIQNYLQQWEWAVVMIELQFLIVDHQTAVKTLF